MGNQKRKSKKGRRYTLIHPMNITDMCVFYIK